MQKAQTRDDHQKEPSLSVNATINVAKEDASSLSESHKQIAVQSAQQSSPDMHAIPKKAEPLKEESFKSSPQPDISAVFGKAQGLGSSFFSSASNLISSALQDEPSITPPTSRKGSSISEISENDSATPHTLQRQLIAQKEEKSKLKIKSDDQTNVSPSLVEKDKDLKKPLKPCPLCKVPLTKDPPNYDTCTECKTTVCNLCGFSPMPQQTEVSI